jgi:hypothetical protein
MIFLPPDFIFLLHKKPPPPPPTLISTQLWIRKFNLRVRESGSDSLRNIWIRNTETKVLVTYICPLDIASVFFLF